MARAFARSAFNQDINSWQVQRVTEASYVFNAAGFNQPLGAWQLESVRHGRSMAGIFQSAARFAQDVSAWNVAKVTALRNIFHIAGLRPCDKALLTEAWSRQPSADLGALQAQNFFGAAGWAADSATCFRLLKNSTLVGLDNGLDDTLIRAATKLWLLGQTAGKPAGLVAAAGRMAEWRTERVRSMANLFNCNPSHHAGVYTVPCEKFNAGVVAWRTTAVTSIRGLFRNAAAFNQNIDSWSTDKVTDMTAAFEGAAAFGQGLGSWGVARVRSMADIFKGARNLGNCNKYTTSIGWTAQSIDLSRLRAALGVAWDEDAAECNATGLTDGNVRFVVGVWLGGDAESIAPLQKNLGAIGSWDMRGVTDLSGLFDCETRHLVGPPGAGCKAFSADIGRWDVARVTSLRNTFRGAKMFNAAIGRWNVARATTL